MNSAAPVVVPTTFREAYGAEFHRAFRPPFGAPSTALGNGILAAGGYWFLPASITDQLFSLHGPLAFAVVLASWMYSDVPATNVLGETADLTLAVLDHRKALLRIVAAKNAVLWTLISPICITVSLWIGITERSIFVTALAAIWIAVVPFGTLAFASWMGVLFPYHPLHLRDRFRLGRHGKANRRHYLWRWIALVTLPYVIVPALAAALISPVLILWGVTAKDWTVLSVHVDHLTVGVTLSVLLSVLWMWLGRRGFLWLCQKRDHKLRTYLADPSRG
jgi:hypothetical protein